MFSISGTTFAVMNCGPLVQVKRKSSKARMSSRFAGMPRTSLGSASADTRTVLAWQNAQLTNTRSNPRLRRIEAPTGMSLSFRGSSLSFS